MNEIDDCEQTQWCNCKSCLAFEDFVFEVQSKADHKETPRCLACWFVNCQCLGKETDNE